MQIRDLLLKSYSFSQLLKQLNVDSSDFLIKDEKLILHSMNDSFQEKVVIECQGPEGILNLVGVLHCNFLKEIAVFELDSVEKQRNVS